MAFMNKPHSPKRRSKGPDRKRRQPKESTQFGSNSGGRKAAGGKAPADDLYLFGIHTVRAALENPNRRKIKLYATQNALKKIETSMAASADLEIEICDARQLDKMVTNDSVHQGLVLKCLPLDTLDASELFNLADANLVVILDQITDPHNAGAILRSACALGADAVIMTSRNSAHETAILAKSASGALDHTKLVHLKNLSKGIAELNDMGFFSFGLDSSAPLVVEDTLQEANPSKIALVLGAENKGLREKTRQTCKAMARLDMPGPIKSLNVSNAAIVSLYLARAHLRNLSK